jgi:hypothetical protein
LIHQYFRRIAERATEVNLRASTGLLAAAKSRSLAHSTLTGGEFGGAFGLSIRVRGEGGIGSGQMRLPASRAGHCVVVSNQLLELVSAIFTHVFEYRHLVPFYPIFENPTKSA